MIARVAAIAALASTIAIAGCVSAPSSQMTARSVASAEAEVRAAAGEFVAAFNGLDQARFDALWADDATVFYPQPPFPIRRVEGKADVTAWFRRFMDSQRDRNTSPGVDPQELSIQMTGADGAVVSFHLGTDPERAARRTLVYRREPGGWRIIHLHASSLAAPKP